MSEEGPKLFTNKPKKSKLKPVTPSTMAASSSTGTAPVVPPSTAPPPPPKESFARRYKFMWPLLLGVNFVVGVYLFTRTSKKDVGTEEAENPDAPTASTPTSHPPVTISENLATQATVEPVQLAPIPEDQQRELYKWLLEQKRKIKPEDSEEKKRIDEEKAVLKQFIRAKSIPSV